MADQVAIETITLATGEKIQVIQYDIPEARIFEMCLTGEPTKELEGFVFNWRVLVQRKEDDDALG